MFQAMLLNLPEKKQKTMAEDKREPMPVEENIEESKEKPESEGILDELLGNEK